MIKIIDVDNYNKQVWINPNLVETVYTESGTNYDGVSFSYTKIRLTDCYYRVEASIEEVLRLLRRGNAS